MSLLRSFRGIPGVQCPSFDGPGDEHEGLVPEEPLDHNGPESEPLDEFAVEVGGDLLGVIFQAGEVDSVNQATEGVGEDLSDARQPDAIWAPAGKLTANDVYPSEGLDTTTAGRAEPLPPPTSQTLGLNVAYPEVFGTANETVLAIFLSLANAAYHALGLVLPPNDKSSVEGAYNSRTSSRSYPESAAIDSEPLAFELSMMSKSIYFCH